MCARCVENEEDGGERVKNKINKKNQIEHDIECKKMKYDNRRTEAMDFMLFGGARAAARCSCMLLGGARAVGRGRRWNGAKSCHSRCLFLKLIRIKYIKNLDSELTHKYLQ